MPLPIPRKQLSYEGIKTLLTVTQLIEQGWREFKVSNNGHCWITEWALGKNLYKAGKTANGDTLYLIAPFKLLPEEKYSEQNTSRKKG